MPSLGIIERSESMARSYKLLCSVRASKRFSRIRRDGWETCTEAVSFDALPRHQETCVTMHANSLLLVLRGENFSSMSNFYKFLYNHLLPPLFRMQEHISWFIWIPILGDVVRIKQRAIDYLQLQKGDKVLVYSIGSGFEAKLILDRVGREGSIIGVDFSEGMLKLAQEMVDRNNWSNVKLVMADVREYDPLKDVNHKFDAALSNFGYLDKMVLYNLVNAVKAGGMIAISGPQPLKGIRKIFYPITFVPEMIFGLTWRTLHKFPMYIDILRNELTNIHIDERTFAKYFVAVSGRRK